MHCSKTKKAISFSLQNYQKIIRLTHLAIWGNILSWFVFLMVYSKFWPTLPIAPDMVAINELVFGTWVFWLGLALVPLTALTADVIYKVVKKTCFRNLADEMAELDRLQQRSISSRRSVSNYQSIVTGTNLLSQHSS